MFLNLTPTTKIDPKGQKIAPKCPKKVQKRPEMWPNLKHKVRAVLPKPKLIVFVGRSQKSFQTGLQPEKRPFTFQFSILNFQIPNFPIPNFRSPNSEFSNSKRSNSEVSNSECSNSEFSNFEFSNSEVSKSKYSNSEFSTPNFEIPNSKILNFKIRN